MTFPITFLTLFPHLFPGMLEHSIPGRAMEKSLWACNTIDIRTFATDKHRTVDDTPYGGGAGMVMRPDVVAAAIRESRKQTPNARVVYLSAAGQPLTQETARHLSQGEGLTLLCGHYEGIDQRVLDAEVDEEICIGPYVLSGGEPAAMVLADSVIRLLPGALGTAESLHEESFDLKDDEGNTLVEYPHYTRPETWEGHTVPEVLRSGHHQNIKKWRLEQAKSRTKALKA